MCCGLGGTPCGNARRQSGRCDGLDTTRRGGDARPGRPRDARTASHVARDGRSHLELRAVDEPDATTYVAEVVTALSDVAGVSWVEPLGITGHVVVAHDPDKVSIDERRLGGVDAMVMSLCAKGLTAGEIAAHLAEVYGADVSKDTI